jgi:hypothetical protein
VVEVGVAEGAGVVESPPSHSAELVAVATDSVLPEMIEATGSTPVAVASLQEDSRGKKGVSLLLPLETSAYSGIFEIHLEQRLSRCEQGKEREERGWKVSF